MNVVGIEGEYISINPWFAVRDPKCGKAFITREKYDEIAHNSKIFIKNFNNWKLEVKKLFDDALSKDKTLQSTYNSTMDIISSMSQCFEVFINSTKDGDIDFKFEFFEKDNRKDYGKSKHFDLIKDMFYQFKKIRPYMANEYNRIFN